MERKQATASSTDEGSVQGLDLSLKNIYSVFWDGTKSEPEGDWPLSHPNAYCGSCPAPAIDL